MQINFFSARHREDDIRLALHVWFARRSRVLAGDVDGNQAQYPDLGPEHRPGLSAGTGQTIQTWAAQRPGPWLYLVVPQPAAAGAADLYLQPAPGAARHLGRAGRPVLVRPAGVGDLRDGVRGRNPPWWFALDSQRPGRSGAGVGLEVLWHPVARGDSPGVARGPAVAGQRVHLHRQAHLAGVGDLADRDFDGRPTPVFAELPG